MAITELVMDATVVVRPDAILEVVMSGPGDYAYCATMLRRIAAELAARPGFSGLIDIRELDYVPTVDEAQRLAELYVQHRTAFGGRVAVLARPGEQFGMARLRTITASLGGVQVEAFTARANAIAWLTERRP